MKGEPVVGVQPEIFRWARASVGLSVADVAAMLKRQPEEIESWEAGKTTPTYPQNVCAHFKIPCIDLEEFMHQQGWTF